jgi:spore coat protein CotH
MNERTRRRRRWRRNWIPVTALTATVAVLVVGFGEHRVRAVTSAPTSVRPPGEGDHGVAGTVELFSEGVHEIELEFDQDDYDRMIETFQDDGTKEYLDATITIDGTTIEHVGIRLKGNSSLAGIGGGLGMGGGGFPGGEAPEGVEIPEGGGPPEGFELPEGMELPEGFEPPAGNEAPQGGPGQGGGRPGGGAGAFGGAADVEKPETLPWLVKFDEFVDGQSYEGHEELAIRSSSTETAINEAVALELVGLSGQPTQESFHSAVSVNGGDQDLRLVVEVPDSVWAADNFDGTGTLYKALSTGSWDYRGEDPLDYSDSFSIESRKKEADLQPVIDLLRFLETSSDEEFARHLDEWVDVEDFATYLALQDVLANFDDISGPGNNLYLWYDLESGRFQVLTWDLNLALSGAAFGPPGGAAAPTDTGATQEGGQQTPPEGQPSQEDPPQGGLGMMGGRNVLAERFMADETFSRLYEERLAELQAELVDSGAAEEIVDRLEDSLLTNAGDLVASDTITSEADAIRAQLS